MVRISGIQTFRISRKLFKEVSLPFAPVSKVPEVLVEWKALLIFLTLLWGCTGEGEWWDNPNYKEKLSASSQLLFVAVALVLLLWPYINEQYCIGHEK